MISPLTPLDFLARSVHAWRDLTAIVEGGRLTFHASAEFGVGEAAVAAHHAGLLRVKVYCPVERPNWRERHVHDLAIVSGDRKGDANKVVGPRAGWLVEAPPGKPAAGTGDYPTEQ